MAPVAGPAAAVANNNNNSGTSIRGNSRRDSSSTTSSSSATAANSKPIQKYLINCKSIYTCIYCRTHLANHDELVSRSFQGNHGRAYLFNSVINVSSKLAVIRGLNTGPHAVADIYCENCQTTLGWKYERAFVDSQKYKEGKYIIELAHVVRENNHLELDLGGGRFSRKVRNNSLSPPTSSLNEPPGSGAGASGGHWSSPPSSSSSASSPPSDIDFDEDLRSVLFDKVGNKKSGYASCSLSPRQHDRIRRSLYLGSTPFDWKNNSDTSSYTCANSVYRRANGNDDNNRENIKNQSEENNNGSQFDDADYIDDKQLQKPSTSLSLTSDSELKQKSFANIHGDTDKSANEDDINNDIDANDSETQFKFEVDKCEPEEDGQEAGPNKLNDDKCLKQDLGGDYYNVAASSRVQVAASVSGCARISNSARTSARPLIRSHATDRGCNEQISNLNAQSESEHQLNAKNDNSINLDDEEFYDCYTEHELSNFEH